VNAHTYLFKAFKNRIIVLSDEINDVTASLVVAQMLFWSGRSRQGYTVVYK